jgi:hypothetical protein
MSPGFALGLRSSSVVVNETNEKDSQPLDVLRLIALMKEHKLVWGISQGECRSLS